MWLGWDQPIGVLGRDRASTPAGSESLTMTDLMVGGDYYATPACAKAMWFWIPAALLTGWALVGGSKRGTRRTTRRTGTTRRSTRRMRR